MNGYAQQKQDGKQITFVTQTSADCEHANIDQTENVYTDTRLSVKISHMYVV